MKTPLTIPEIRREIPVSGSYDVIVAGGGPAGVGAAISAARAGVKVAILEQHGFMGGVCCAAMSSAWNNWDREGAPEVEGLYEELIDRLSAINGIVGSRDGKRQCFYDVEALKYILDTLMSETGAMPLLHTVVADAIVSQDRVTGVAIQNKSGRQAILGRVVVDATGDADVAFTAGVPCTKGREPDGLMQPASLIMKVGNVDVDGLEGYLKEHPSELLPGLAHLKNTYDGVIDNLPQMKFGKLDGPFLGRSYMGFPSAVRKAESEGLHLFTNYVIFHSTPRKDEVMVNMTRVTGVDASNGASVSKAEIEGRRQVRVIMEFLINYLPGFKECYLVQTAPHIGLRESRRIVGEHILTEEDCVKGIFFPDTIATAYSTCLDVFSPTGKGFTMFKALDHPVHIPYRSLVPKRMDGLLVAGRCLSATHVGFGAVRSQHKVMAAGQAAGIAAALSVKNNVQPRALNVELIQSELKRQGVNFG